LLNGGYLRLVLNGVYSRDLPVYLRAEVALPKMPSAHRSHFECGHYTAYTHRECLCLAEHERALSSVTVVAPHECALCRMLYILYE
jgi:hypothetical protein